MKGRLHKLPDPEAGQWARGVATEHQVGEAAVRKVNSQLHVQKPVCASWNNQIGTLDHQIAVSVAVKVAHSPLTGVYPGPQLSRKR